MNDLDVSNKLTTMKMEKVSPGLVLVTTLGLALAACSASGIVFRIQISVKKKAEDGDGTLDEINRRVARFQGEVNKIIATLPLKTRGHKSKLHFRETKAKAITAFSGPETIFSSEPVVR